MSQLPLFDAQKSKAERDAALAQVAANAGVLFMTRGMAALRRLSGQETNGEEIRRALTQQGITPHHSNAWGSLIRNAVQHGILVDTGRSTLAKIVSSHARRLVVYRVT